MNKGDIIWLKAMELGRKTRCHQMPERSFFIRGRQFPVCSRCAGVFLGWFLSLALVYFYRPNILVIFIFCFVMLADWFLQMKNIIKNNNIRRFITGTLGGYALMSVYIEIIMFLFKLIFK